MRGFVKQWDYGSRCYISLHKKSYLKKRISQFFLTRSPRFRHSCLVRLHIIPLVTSPSTLLVSPPRIVLSPPPSAPPPPPTSSNHERQRNYAKTKSTRGAEAQARAASPNPPISRNFRLYRPTTTLLRGSRQGYQCRRWRSQAQWSHPRRPSSLVYLVAYSNDNRQRPPSARTFARATCPARFII
jgi:hypothetical protein